MGTILVAIAIMTGLGVFFGIGLAIANRFLRVEEDPRIDIIEGMLPGSNCGACGQARQIAEYEGHGSCSAAHIVGAGGKGCSWGCLGLADCQVACDFDAIHMNDQLLPVVDVDKCTACGDCVEACPRGLFELMPLSHKLVVQCNAPLEGEEARAVCAVACDACGRCAQDAAPGLIRMVNNLPLIDYAAGGPASPAATFRCPTGAIKWIDGNQFGAARLVQLTLGDHGD